MVVAQPRVENSDSESMLIVGKTRFADGLDVGSARKALSKDFGLSNWVNRGAGAKLWDLGRAGLGEEVRS